MQHEIRQMRQNGGGATVNQSSVTSDIAGTPRNGLYAATKAAVLSLTKTAALEVAKDNISVNAIGAAAIDVPGDMIWQWIEQEGVTAEQIATALPVGRTGRPEELVAAVLFLCSDTARFIVDQTLVLDGGFSVQ